MVRLQISSWYHEDSYRPLSLGICPTCQLIVWLYCITFMTSWVLLYLHTCRSCSGHKKNSVCRCCHRPVKCVICVEMTLRGVFGVGVGTKRMCGKGTVNSQHGTSVERNSHICTKGYHSSKDLLIFNLFATWERGGRDPITARRVPSK